MTQRFSRRSFLSSSAALGAGGLLTSVTGDTVSAAQDDGEGSGSGMPVAISSGNGLRTTAKAVELMKAGTDGLEAAIAGVNIVEEDPADMSVGYGGLPNEDGVVQLDSCCMHGPTYNAGSVAAIEGIKTPSKIAHLVMTRTDHVMLVGKGAQRFAQAHGYKLEDLLTDKARKAWLKWKESLSDRDDWLTPAEAEAPYEKARQTGTITCLTLNDKKELSGVTTTSGLAYKIPGRIGDSPIISAGLYVDNDAGACGATGRGEAVILSGGSRIVVENMRRGMNPKDAIRDVPLAHREADGRPSPPQRGRTPGLRCHALRRRQTRSLRGGIDLERPNIRGGRRQDEPDREGLRAVPTGRTARQVGCSANHSKPSR